MHEITLFMQIDLKLPRKALGKACRKKKSIIRFAWPYPYDSNGNWHSTFGKGTGKGIPKMTAGAIKENESRREEI